MEDETKAPAFVLSTTTTPFSNYDRVAILKLGRSLRELSRWSFPLLPEGTEHGHRQQQNFANGKSCSLLVTVFLLGNAERIFDGTVKLYFLVLALTVAAASLRCHRIAKHFGGKLNIGHFLFLFGSAQGWRYDGGLTSVTRVSTLRI